MPIVAFKMPASFAWAPLIGWKGESEKQSKALPITSSDAVKRSCGRLAVGDWAIRVGSSTVGRIGISFFPVCL